MLHDRINIMNWNNQGLIDLLKGKEIAVIPTDTIYGIVGSALDQDTVERIYKIKKRNINKPCIILIGDISELGLFNVILGDMVKNVAEKYWSSERPTSITLPCFSEKFHYLHRGEKTLAFRLPRSKELRDFLSVTGPLIAPSANLEGFPPARNIEEARKYFGDSVSFYLDGGIINGEASQLISLLPDGTVRLMRS